MGCGVLQQIESYTGKKENMKKKGVLNSQISSIIASMGHMDQITICDAGYPIPQQVERIDLALIPGVPNFLQVVKAVMEDLEVEKIILAEEIKEQNPKVEKILLDLFKGINVEYQSHSDVKALSQESRAVIRTGECTPYANIILVSGVTF